MQMSQLINNDQDDRFVKYQFFISSSFFILLFQRDFHSCRELGSTMSFYY